MYLCSAALDESESPLISQQKSDPDVIPVFVEAGARALRYYSKST